MIVRVLTGRWLGRDSALSVVGRKVTEDARKASGNVSATFGRQTNGTDVRFVLVTVWRSPDAVYKWAGTNLLRPRWLEPHLAETQVIDIQHYETVDDPVPAEEAATDERIVAEAPTGRLERLERR